MELTCGRHHDAQAQPHHYGNLDHRAHCDDRRMLGAFRRKAVSMKGWITLQASDAISCIRLTLTLLAMAVHMFFTGQARMFLDGLPNNDNEPPRIGLA